MYYVEGARSVGMEAIVFQGDFGEVEKYLQGKR